MESHDPPVVSAHTIQEPRAAAPEDTNGPAAEKTQDHTKKESSKGSNTSPTTTPKRADRTDSTKDKKHAVAKKSGKHHRKNRKVVKHAVVADTSDSSSSDDDSDLSDESDDDSDTDSDSSSEEEVVTKKKQKSKKPKKSVKIKLQKKKGLDKRGLPGKKFKQNAQTSDTSDSDGSDVPLGSSKRGRAFDFDLGNDIGGDPLSGLQFQMPPIQQLQVSPMQQPLTVAPYGIGMPTNVIYVNGAAPGGARSVGMPNPMLGSSNSLPPPPPPPNSLPLGRGRRGGLKNWPPRGRRNPLPTEIEFSDSLSDGEGGKRSSRKKKPTKADFKRVDWIWDSSVYTYRLQDTAESTSDTQYNEYIFHVRRTFDCENRYRETFVDIKSKLLRECLQDVIGNVQGVSLVDETPKLSPNLLFLYLEEFRDHRKHLKHTEPAGKSKKDRKKNQKRIDGKRKELKVLIKYLDKDFAKVKDSLYPMLESGLITFDLLWALWKPNTLAYTTTYGTNEEPRVFKVEMAERQSSILNGDFYYIDGKYFEYDGKKFGYGGLSEEIADFHGARKITSLSCYPLKYHKNEAKVRAELIERGKKFVALGGVQFKSYSGIAYVKRKRNAIIKYNIPQSRVMVDPAIFRRVNPNYMVSLLRSKDHDILSDDDLSDDEGMGLCGCDSSDEERRYVTKVFKDPKGDVRMARIPKDSLGQDVAKEDLKMPTPKDGSEKTDEDQTVADTPSEEQGIDTPPEFSDEEYLTASPVVLGFAFSEKQWLEFRVSGVKEIKWNDNAWDSLVLEPSTKDLIQALVKSRKYNASQTIDDVIQGKGKGLVTVLHGPPGTGKTLTAEGISELLKCPLYMVSAGELGTDSRMLEAELQKLLDICHAWGAILLLDEADVFLEKRDMHEIHRNALVSIFLRQLEYFQGILFLTTNRVETFDEAFQSRIHIALRYEALDTKAKKAIFKMFIERVRSHGKMDLQAFTEDDFNLLAKRELNGREIKNVVGSAQDLALNKGEALGMSHIRQVLDVHAKFGRDLRGGNGYEEAMRSYF